MGDYNTSIDIYNWINNKRIEEERLIYKNGRICNIVVIHCHAAIDNCKHKMGLFYLILLPTYGAFELTKQMFRAELPYPDCYAVCYDHSIINNQPCSKFGDLIRHVKTNCDRFEVELFGKTYDGSGGICLFEEYIDIKCVKSYTIKVTSRDTSCIDWILCGEITQDVNERNNELSGSLDYIHERIIRH